MAQQTKLHTGYPHSRTGSEELAGSAAANDILTLTEYPGQTGDILVWQTSAFSELGYIDSAGDINLNKTDQTTFSKLKLPILNTAPSSAGLVKGDLWLAKATTDVYRMAMCISTAAGYVRYGDRITMSTIGDANVLDIAAGEVVDISAKGAVGQTSFARLRLPILSTAPASAGLAKGDLWLSKATTDIYRLTLCISTVTGAVKYGSRITRDTIGTASN